jgi:oligosaccharide translocation protein RFT1
MAFGPSYSYSLIRLLYGKKWSDGEASTVLRYYCFYVIVLAMNGNSPCLLLLNFLFVNDIYHGLLWP